MEVVRTDDRGQYGIKAQYGFSMGVMSVNLIADLKFSWRTYQLIAVFPTTFLLTAFAVVPESPRWLLLSYDMVGPSQVIRHAGRSSTTYPDMCGVSSMACQDDLALRRTTATSEAKISGGASPITSFFRIDGLDVLASQQLRHVHIALSITWAACGLTFYGLSLSPEASATLHFLRSVVTALLPVYAAASVVEWLGRRFTIACFLFVAGVLHFFAAATVHGSNVSWLETEPSQTLQIWLETLVLSAVMVAYVTTMLYTAELYPTTVRCVGFCLAIVMGRLTVIILPVIEEVGLLTNDAVPYMLFGLTCLLSGILVLRLPETMAEHLTEAVKMRNSCRLQPLRLRRAIDRKTVKKRSPRKSSSTETTRTVPESSTDPSK